MLCVRDPDSAGRLREAKEYALHKGRRQLLTANWKTADHGVIVYTAGALDVHMRDTYHNAYHISKRASRKENMYSHLRKEDKMRRRNGIYAPSGVATSALDAHRPLIFARARADFRRGDSTRLRDGLSKRRDIAASRRPKCRCSRTTGRRGPIATIRARGRREGTRPRSYSNRTGNLPLVRNRPTHVSFPEIGRGISIIYV